MNIPMDEVIAYIKNKEKIRKIKIYSYIIKKNTSNFYKFIIIECIRKNPGQYARRDNDNSLTIVWYNSYVNGQMDAIIAHHYMWPWTKSVRNVRFPKSIVLNNEFG